MEAAFSDNAVRARRFVFGLGQQSLLPHLGRFCQTVYLLPSKGRLKPGAPLPGHRAGFLADAQILAALTVTVVLKQ